MLIYEFELLNESTSGVYCMILYSVHNTVMHQIADQCSCTAPYGHLVFLRQPLRLLQGSPSTLGPGPPCGPEFEFGCWLAGSRPLLSQWLSSPPVIWHKEQLPVV